jgi:SAM-dependent methyltransferase
LKEIWSLAQSKFYDEKYSQGYRSELSGFELAREDALQHFIEKVISISNPGRVLDYGAGRGLHLPLWRKVFPMTELFLCDVSTIAMSNCIEKNPEISHHYRLIENNRADFNDGYFDLIVSVEVMEHVADLSAYLSDIFRLLRPGGMFVFTTPCANRFSIEHIYSLITGKIDATTEGYRRWSWEDPTHVRRLRSSEIQFQLSSANFSATVFRFRSHIFSFLCTYLPPRKRFRRVRNWLMTMDYKLFRNLPNGASVLGAAGKT